MIIYDLKIAEIRFLHTEADSELIIDPNISVFHVHVKRAAWIDLDFYEALDEYGQKALGSAQIHSVIYITLT